MVEDRRCRNRISNGGVSEPLSDFAQQTLSDIAKAVANCRNANHLTGDFVFMMSRPLAQPRSCDPKVYLFFCVLCGYKAALLT
jgi:hypothetical protein